MSDSGETSGTRLKAERERRGLTVQKAADEMRLDVWVIDALETGEYERLGPSVYAKGHLKKYASILGLPPAEILAEYEAEAIVAKTPAAPPSTVRLSTADPAENTLPWPRIAAFAAAAALLIGILWWRPWQHRTAAKPAVNAQAVQKPHSPANARPPAQHVTVAAHAVPPAPTVSRESAPAPLASVASAPAAVSAAPATSVAAIAAATPAAAIGHARLRLSFSADSWVVVRDAANKRVFAGYGRANSVKTITGNAPLRVYLGFASGVQLEVNQRAVAIGPQFVAGDVARFEAGADGVLRRDAHPVSTRDLRPHR